MTQPDNKDQPTSTAISSGLQEAMSSLDGMALPPIVKRGLLHAMNRLLGGLVDIPVAHLEARTQRIKTEANAQSAFTMSVAQVAAAGFNQDPELVNRAVLHYGAKLIREQDNRERISQRALEDLRLNPPKEDAKEEVNDDWLETFSRIAETKSAEDIQLILSKILSGELRQPGSYKQRTLHVLSTLDQQTGKIFQAFCNVSFQLAPMGDNMTCVMAEPFGLPGDNGLSPLGLAYSHLTQLQDAGLIQHDLHAWRQFNPLLFSMPFTVGNKGYGMKPTADSGSELQKVAIINFTTVGLELRRVLELSSNPVYNQKFEEWIRQKFKLVD